MLARLVSAPVIKIVHAVVAVFRVRWFEKYNDMCGQPLVPLHRLPSDWYMSREAAHARPAPCSPWWADASDDDDNGNDAVPVEPPMKILIDVALIDSESSVAQVLVPAASVFSLAPGFQVRGSGVRAPASAPLGLWPSGPPPSLGGDYAL